MERNSQNRRKPAKIKTKKQTKTRGRKVRRILWASFITVAAGLFCAMAAYMFIIISGDRYLKENLGEIDFKETTIVYDNDGKEAAKLFTENREYVYIDEVPELLKQAFIATEDKRFAEHEGIDYIGIGRALIKDIIARKAVEGASTITQQLAKNLFLTNEKTFFRKATELSIATALEAKFEKDEILEMYLNRIFFGKAAYGIKAATKTYFGKDDLNDLELHEIATLAAIPKAPSYYNPIDNPEKAKMRRDTVLALMENQGIISMTEKLTAQAQPVDALAYQTNISYPSYIDYVLREVQETTDLTEEELYNNGYHIYTMLNVKAQKSLEDAFEDPANFPKDGPEQKVQSSMVIVDNADGGIAAMIGGRDYARKGLNRATVKRQPGSSFKPIAVYAPAIETGNWNPYSMLSNEKQSFAKYSPRNMDGKYSGKVSMFDAVRKSINIPAVWLLNEIGVKTGLNFASKLGIEMSAEDRNLSIALGGLTHGASPLEMARAFSAFATNGTLHDTHAIVRITDRTGKLVYTFNSKKNAEQVMSEKTAWYTTLLLKNVVAQGTGTKAKVKNNEVAGKTGTTQSGLKGVGGNRDIWFVGYTRDYTAAVWMGYDKTDKNHVLSDYSGTAAALFSKVMNQALAGSKSSLTRPKDISELKESVDKVTDLSATYSAELQQIELKWTALQGKFEYRLYRKSVEEESFMQIAGTEKVSVIDLMIEPDQTYQYYVTVFDAGLQMESEPSDMVEVIVPHGVEEIPDEDTWDPNTWPDNPGDFPPDPSPDLPPDQPDVDPLPIFPDLNDPLPIDSGDSNNSAR